MNYCTELDPEIPGDTNQGCRLLGAFAHGTEFRLSRTQRYCCLRARPPTSRYSLATSVHHQTLISWRASRLPSRCRQSRPTFRCAARMGTSRLRRSKFQVPRDSSGLVPVLGLGSGRLTTKFHCRKLKVAAIHGKVVNPRCNSTEPRLFVIVHLDSTFPASIHHGFLDSRGLGCSPAFAPRIPR